MNRDIELSLTKLRFPFTQKFHFQPMLLSGHSSRVTQAKLVDQINCSFPIEYQKSFQL